MSGTDTVQAALTAYSSGDAQALAALLTDDMTLSGPVPQPLDKQGFVGLAVASHAAFPDWNFNGHDWQETGDTVSGVISISGTHTGTLAIIPGVPPVAPTGKSVKVPDEPIAFTLRGGQISAIVVQPIPNAGVPALYAQVGAPLSH